LLFAVSIFKAVVNNFVYNFCDFNIYLFIYLNISGKGRKPLTYMPVKSSTMNIYMLDNETR